MYSHNSPFDRAIHDYRSLEVDAHVSFDDILSKITQEMGELMEALEANDAENIRKEAKDLLVNLLSAGSRIGISPSIDCTERISMDKIPICIAEFHRIIATIRVRYSRDTPVSFGSLHKSLDPLFSTLLALSSEQSYESVIENSHMKFSSRITEYIPHVNIKEHIANYPDFPKPGILFRDISPLLRSESLIRYVGFELAKRTKNADIIAGLDARGFIFATRVAEILEKPFVMIRKKGKLPGEVVSTDYSLEYGNSSIEIQKDAIKPGEKVVLIDDLLATGGTLGAAAELVEKVGGKIEAALCVIALDDPFLQSLPSRKSLESKYRVESVVNYDE